MAQNGETRELAAGIAGAEHRAVGQQPSGVERDLAVVRRQQRERPALRVDEEEIVVEGRVGALHEDAVLRPVDDVRPAAGLRELAAALAGDADDRDVEVDAVAAGVGEGDPRPVGEKAPGTWIASGLAESASSGPPSGSIAKSAWRSLPPASREITQRCSHGERARR